MIKVLQKASIFCLLFFQVLAAQAQDRGDLTGYILDAKTEEPLIGASVRLLDTDYGSITDLEGFFKISNIPTQNYSVQASYVGYKSETRYNVIVRTAGTADLIFRLEEDVNELEGVVVTANPFEKLDETPLSIQSLSYEEISTYPGGNNDIAKVVQSLPGVSGSVGGFRNDVIIRGGAPNENVYYLDGIEIPNINHFATQGSAGGPVGLLNVSFFENVTLSSSSFGSQYDNVLSGVLQFDQRDGNNRNLRTNIRLSSSEAALTMEGPLFKGGNETSNTSFIASVRRSYLQLLFQALDLPFLPDYWDYQYKLSHKINEYNDLSITGVGSIDDFAINVPSDLTEDQQATLEQIPVIKQRTNTTGISWKNRFKDGSGFMTTAVSMNLLENNFTRYRDNVNEQDPILNNVATERETKLRYNITKFKGAWTISGGIVLQNADYQSDTDDILNGFSFSSDLNFWRYGLYGQASRKFANERIGISVGLRTDGNNFTSSGNEMHRTLSPRASFSYTFDNQRKWTLNASIGRYFKIPPYTVLGFQDNEGNFANKDVEYIQSDHIVAGVEYLLNPSTRLSVEGFYKKYANYPVSLTDSVSLANLGGDFSVLGNVPVLSVGLGRTYGVEFLYQQKITKRFYGILAVTLYESEFTGFDQDVYRPSSWDNRTLITFTGGYKFGNNWELSARSRFLGSTPYAPVDIEATNASYPIIIKDYNRQGEVELDAFNQTDIRLDKKWNFKKVTLDVFLELQNVLGQDFPSEPQYGLARDANGIPLVPQQIVEIESVDNGQLLPNIGLVLDF